MAHPAKVGPFTYYPVEFNKDGAAVAPDQLNAVLSAVSTPRAQGGLTDLFVISHGWNDDMPEAEQLYETIFSHVGEVLKQKNPACDDVNARRAAIVGILWPSKKFDDAELIPGGAAAMPGDQTAGLGAQLDRLSALVGSPEASASLARAKTLAPTLASSMEARDEFVRIVRAFMPHDANAEEPVISDDLFTLNGDQLLQRLSRPSHDAPGSGGSGGGGAAGFTDWIGKAVDGAKSLVNLVTYYQMKNRAGAIGQSGVYDMLRRIRDLRGADGDNALKIHMLRHSFGCRLVTAAVAGPANTDPLPVDSMSLLQAAFSHYGFAQSYDGSHDGFFRRVVTDPARVRGPLIITFTSKDKAVGLAYPIASRIARQVASAFGDANDPYGGLGRNGAQKTPGSQVVALAQTGSAYSFAARGVYSLDANAVITAHSDLGHDEVGWAIVAAVAGT
jgi:hypothetical protein